MTATRGTALLHQHHAGWTPWAGELPHRMGGAMIADRIGDVTGYALDNLQLRGELFVGPGDICYEGMVIGEGSRRATWWSTRFGPRRRPTSGRTATTTRSSWPPPIDHTLESAIEWIGEDELVEVTPDAIRIRKRLLTERTAGGRTSGPERPRGTLRSMRWQRALAAVLVLPTVLGACGSAQDAVAPSASATPERPSASSIVATTAVATTSRRRTSRSAPRSSPGLQR